MILQAIQSVLSLLLLMAVGYYLTGKEWFAKNGADIFSKYAARVAIPCYMFYNVIHSCGTREKLLKLAQNVPIPFATILISFFFGIFLSKKLGVKTGRQGVFVNAVTFSNVVLIGFPVINSLLGDYATPDGMIYYMANTLLFWTLGTYLLRRDGAQKAKFFSLNNLKKAFSPPIIGMVLGVLVVLLNITVPDFIFSPITKISQSTTPIAMMFIGSILCSTDFKKIEITRDLAAVVFIRFVISPIFMAVICMMLPVDSLMKEVFFVLATMPAMTQLGIMAKESDSDYEFASVLVAVTSALSMVALPIYVFIISMLHIF